MRYIYGSFLVVMALWLTACGPMTIVTGTRLAAQFGMGWFCAGFGFGEIELAYDLSAQTGGPPSNKPGGGPPGHP